MSSSYSNVKEARYRDVEAAGGAAFVAPVALFRRRKFCLVVLLLPLAYVGLVYSGIVESSFSFHFGRDYKWGQHKPAASLTEPSAELDPLVAKIPAPAHGDAGVTASFASTSASASATPGAPLDAFGQKAKDALASANDLLAATRPDALKGDGAQKVAPLDGPFNNKNEATLLLLQALKTPDYLVPKDWRAVYLDREGSGSIFGLLDGGPKNKFTQLLSNVGLDPAVRDDSPSQDAQPKALAVYRKSRADWVKALRASNGLTVFSKSYCPYSLKAKELLRELGATFTSYEIDLRADAHTLQSLLAEVTGHRTFPTVLVRDTLVGGSDDLLALHRVDALRDVLKGVGAL